MFKKIFLTAAVVLLVVGVGAVAFASSSIGIGCGFGWNAAAYSNGNGASVFDQLDLSDEQYAKLRDILNQSFEKMQALRDEMAKKMLELKNLYLQKTPDKDAIEAKQKEISELREKMLQLRQDNIDEMNNVLTQEQLNKLNSLRGNGLGKGAGLGWGCGFGRGVGRGMAGRSGVNQ
ncbi:MAG: hypothetical protein PWQ97_1304 [Tepidanaerobacteraceae bacterium]|nr:hypothetical protein [Tepidanaerobacteraceae bacterium]